MVLGATVGNRNTRAADSGFVEMGRNFQQMDNMPAPGTSILVVDDEPQVVWVLQFSLEAEGYQTFAAATVSRPCREISEHHPKMMVLDIMMPTMDGWSVLEEMTELPREERPRVVVVSALASAARSSEGRRARRRRLRAEAVQRGRAARGPARPRTGQLVGGPSFPPPCYGRQVILSPDTRAAPVMGPIIGEAFPDLATPRPRLLFTGQAFDTWAAGDVVMKFPRSEDDARRLTVEVAAHPVIADRLGELVPGSSASPTPRTGSRSRRFAYIRARGRQGQTVEGPIIQPKAWARTTLARELAQALTTLHTTPLKAVKAAGDRTASGGAGPAGGCR